MKSKHFKLYLTLAILMLLMVPQRAWAQSTAYVSTYEELSAAISNASINNIIVTANIDVPCGTSGNAGSTSTDLTGASTAQLIINRSLTLQSQSGSKYIIKRVAANGATSSALKSMIAIRGNGHGTSGTANLTENTIQVTFTNIIIDGGANFGLSSVRDRRNGAANAYGNAGRSMIDVYLGGMLNLEDGVEIRNGFTTKPDNSLLNDPSCSMCFGGAVRVDYHNNTGGGTVNIKAGATIHDCTARGGGYGGALGAYNYARLNLYGGTIYDCSADNGGAIACTYRSASGYVDATAGTIRMYGGTISNCYAENGGALCTHGAVNDYVLGGTITSCSATYGGAICQDYGATVIHTVHQNSGELTISNCTNNYETSTANTGGYHFIYLRGGSINVTQVYQVTFRNNNTDFAVLSVAQGTSLGEAFPAAPVNASLRFVGWFNGDTQVTSTTVINSDITVTAKWDFLGSGTLASPYEIPSTDAWNFLADNVNNGNTYSGKYFQLTNDITVTTMVTATFSGTFDGNGHTLTVNLSGEENMAPFQYLNGGTIMNLTVTGTVTGGANYCSGLVARTSGGVCLIDNCVVNTNNTGVGFVGGVVAHADNATSLTISNCIYGGTIAIQPNGNNENYSGGILGWYNNNQTLDLVMTNCLFKGDYTGEGQFHPIGVKKLDGIFKSINCTNCYYTKNPANINEAGRTFTDGTKVYSILAGNDVTINGLGTATSTYEHITVYSHGIKYSLNSTDYYYAGGNEEVSLNLDYTSHSGYSFHSFTASGGTLTGSGNPYSLAMPAANVIINARYSTSINITATTTDAKDGWYLIASPFVSVTPSTENGFITNSYDLFQFNQSAEMEWQNWEQTGSHYHFDLEPGRGYLYANSSDVTLTFIGTPYSGTGEVNLEYSTANPDERMRGWNLIGNPFGVTATITRPCYKMKDTNNGVILHNGSELNPVTVNPMEGVFVYAETDGEKVTFTPGGSKRGESNENNIVINLNDTKGNVIDRAIVSFEKDHTLPKFQINESSTKLYIPQKGNDYAMAFSYRIGELPLNFKAQETGKYTIAVVETHGHASLHDVSLVDMIDNVVIDMSVNDTYTFVGTPTDPENRFKLVFNSSNDSNLYIFAYQSGDEIVVSGEGELQVFDVMGRLILTHRVTGVETFAKPSQSGVYIFRLNGKTQKIVVR